MTGPESEVRTVIEDVAAAIRAKDVDAVMAHYAPDVIAFDLLPPLQYSGAAMIRQRLSTWLSSFQGPIVFEMRELSIAAAADVAYSHSLNHVKGTTKAGHEVDMWWRATNCLRKAKGRWLVTHGHSSEPFDMESGKALVDLKP